MWVVVEYFGIEDGFLLSSLSFFHSDLISSLLLIKPSKTKRIRLSVGKDRLPLPTSARVIPVFR